MGNGLINKMKSQTKTGSLILQRQQEALR